MHPGNVFHIDDDAIFTKQPITELQHEIDILCNAHRAIANKSARYEQHMHFRAFLDEHADPSRLFVLVFVCAPMFHRLMQNTIASLCYSPLFLQTGTSLLIALPEITELSSSMHSLTSATDLAVKYARTLFPSRVLCVLGLGAHADMNFASLFSAWHSFVRSRAIRSDVPVLVFSDPCLKPGHALLTVLSPGESQECQRESVDFGTVIGTQNCEILTRRGEVWDFDSESTLALRDSLPLIIERLPCNLTSFRSRIAWVQSLIRLGVGCQLMILVHVPSYVIEIREALKSGFWAQGLTVRYEQMLN